MRFAGLLFDFDGVLIESEAVSSAHIAATLTALGHPTSQAEAMRRFTGLAAQDFIAAVAAWIGGPVPQAFHDARAAEDARVVAAGVPAVAGAVAFVRALPAALPVAIVSSSTTRWIAAHLAHIGLSDRFGARIFSGREHVARGKPAPDIYLHGAAALGLPIDKCAIIEDSEIGATGAVASGAYVIGLCAASHCGAGHADRLRAIGVADIAADFAEVTRIVGL